jgi:hypothetical protein
MQFPARSALALLLAVFLLSEGSAENVAVFGCAEGRDDPAAALMPIKSGPLSLEKIYCLKLPSSYFTVSPPQPSPDQNSAFVFDGVKGLSIVGMGSETALQHFDGRVTPLQSFTGSIPFTWSRNSGSVFGVRQDTAIPSGFALGPLAPFLFRNDGTSEKLADLTSPAGPLDEIYWIGHAGLAVAAFGTKGSYYRPEHPDSNPTIAIVDAHAGKVLQSIAIADVPDIAAKSRINGVASDRDGRHVLITLMPDRWLLWGLGQSPRLVPIDVKPWLPYALSPQGESVLIMKNLSAWGPICEFGSRCPAPTPQSGPVAELRELPSGKLLWTVNGTAETFARSDVPAVSSDGRFALISMPTRTVALLSMTNGAILQEISKPWSECAMGFSADGTTIWISGGSRVVFYKLVT